MAFAYKGMCLEKKLLLCMRGGGGAFMTLELWYRRPGQILPSHAAVNIES